MAVQHFSTVTIFNFQLWVVDTGLVQCLLSAARLGREGNSQRPEGTRRYFLEQQHLQYLLSWLGGQHAWTPGKGKVLLKQNKTQKVLKLVNSTGREECVNVEGQGCFSLSLSLEQRQSHPQSCTMKYGMAINEITKESLPKASPWNLTSYTASMLFITTAAGKGSCECNAETTASKE